MSTRENIRLIARAPYNSGHKNCLRKGAMYRKVIVMCQDGIIHLSTLNMSVVVSLLFILTHLAYRANGNKL